MLELDLIVGGYCKEKANKFTEENCLLFEEEILCCETPELYELLAGQKAKEFSPKKFVNEIREF